MSATWVSVDADRLADLASGFDAAAVELEQVLVGLSRAHVRLGWAPEVPGGERGDALAAVAAASARARDLLSAVRARAAAVRAACALYSGSERTVLQLFGPLVEGNGLNLLLLLPAAVAAGEASGPGQGLPTALALLMRSVAPFRPALALVAQGPAGVDPFTRADRRISGITAPALAPPAAADVADIAERVRLTNEAKSGEEGVVDVQRIEHADGTVTWTVSVHGTAGWDPDQPFEAPQNAPTYVEQDSDGASMVLAAMVRAGIPPGQPVLLAGHSQGGMAVTNLANDAAVRSRFTVAAVVTFGAPTSHMAPTGVPVLNVQHRSDPVPALSGQTGARPGGPADGEVVVVRELDASAPAGTAGADAHEMANYVDTAQRLVADDHPGLAEWERDTRHLFAEEGASVTAETFRGTAR